MISYWEKSYLLVGSVLDLLIAYLCKTLIYGFFLILVTVLMTLLLKDRQALFNREIIWALEDQHWLQISRNHSTFLNFSKCHFIFVLCVCTNTYVPVSFFQINNCSQLLIKHNIVEPVKIFSIIPLPVHFPCPRLCVHFPYNTDQNSWSAWPADSALATTFKC